MEALWFLIGAPLLRSHVLFSSSLRIRLLQLFGADIHESCVIKPNVRIKYPWKVRIAEDSWIGEGVWLDSISEISIGSNVCISQGVYICSGSHDWAAQRFDLLLQPVAVEDHVWLAAKSVVAPGSRIQVGTVLTMGSVANGDLEAWGIYSGNPAKKIRSRNHENGESI